MTKPTPLAVRLGQVLRVHRQAAKLSQDDFADRIKMHRAYYSAIERGEKNITLVTLHRIAEGFGVNMSALLTDVG
ncbi:transcriptional regulator [Rhodanobacter thiooxydans]|uniref:Transcriptional regulator n=1 Tax=Rhodanobacter thiooxydans TaxID=416169 RepID=A0A154QIA1_9GAMM|nr:helix-turn-helix transcriptional regulator [Rhodanobacter thiooxydans]KZC23992.1 transcriptional regulator [Rhodanobacter thiooxydans]